MSSGQWEVVGKSKKSQNGKIKTKEEVKKVVKNGPKLEDVVPHSQIKSFYEGMAIDDDRKPKDKKKENDKKKKQDKKAEAKPKPPTTIKESLEVIDPNELATIIAMNKVRFSNAPLVWLKEVAIFLNAKTQIDVEDPTFSHYPSNYPLCVVPDDLRSSLENVLNDAGKANAQLFFDITLTSLANDMSRGQQVNGHRILLQMLAKSYPDFCTASITKSASLRNSYQNRPPIGLSLLWAYGQGGLYDFSVGVKAWQDLFLPIVELKNYTKYVIQYLGTVLEKQVGMDTAKLGPEQLFTMFDLVNSKRNSLSKELSSDLIAQLSKFKEIFFARSGNKFQVTFNQLMKKLPNQYLTGPTLDPYHEVMVASLVDCLWKDDSCNSTWRQLFHKCSKQSATLLDYIDNNWSTVSPKLKLKSLKATVLQFKEVNGEVLKGKKKDEAVAKTSKICQDILDRMTSTRRFPWFWASFILVLSIAGLVAYDVSRVNGDFPKSSTGKLFKDLGILEHSQKAWQKSLSSSARGYIWLEANTPIYYAQTIEVCKPYWQLSLDVLTIAKKKAGVVYNNIQEYVVEKTPVVVAAIDQYAPGLVDNVKSYSLTGYTAISKPIYVGYLYTVDYMTARVFVGEWAPEILQNKTQTVLNVTRTQVSEYFHWFRKQVNLYSEIP